MLVFVAGTTAELIKISPVWRELESRGIPVSLWYTAQHGAGASDTFLDLGLPNPHRWLAGGPDRPDVSSPAAIPSWLASVLRYVRRHRREMRQELMEDGTQGPLMVHGDTFTTVLGALTGRAMGVPVAHLEAGLRSGSWRSPFPEELDRRLVTRLAALHFAPTAVEVSNLRGVKGEVVETGANTVIDALKTASFAAPPAAVNLPERFGLVTLHRFELLRDSDRLREVFTDLAAASSQLPLVLITGSSDRSRFEELGLLADLPGTVTVAPKLAYSQFVSLLCRADLVVTDSGGLQQECHYLGVPCLVHRERTETQAGLGRTTVLSGLRRSAVTSFVGEADRYRGESLVDSYHPSKIVADTLVAGGWI